VGFAALAFFTGLGRRLRPGGTITGTPLAIPSTGAAETATAFTFTSKASGSFTETLTAAASEGTSYTSATLTASK
jgi:hypothetical protein